MKNTQLLFFAIGVFTHSAFPLELVADYKCQVVVVREDSSKTFQTEFMSSFASGAHGGQEQMFSSDGQGGGEDIVTVKASYNWLALSWKQNGKLIAEGHFVVTKPSLEDRAVVLMNPNNSNEQASLDCRPDLPPQ